LANQPANAATKEQIEMVVMGFHDAARRAREAGFDGVEIHGARGYLVDQFLSASTNSRDDEYGGTLERRLRFPREVVRAVRDAVGEMPVSFNFSLYKMDDTKYQPPGGRDEVIAIARELVSSGVDILHVTTRKVLRDEPWGEPLAVTVRNAAPDAGLIVNGGITGLEQAEQALEGTKAQCVSIARALLANPDWIHKVRTSMPRRDYVPGMERQALLAAECQELQAL
jgi:2,4-dienoyl-CoA reductase-like NADH-dependent reductase (Old Yellow Enzyme family)